MRDRFPALETNKHVSVFCHTRTEKNNQRIRRITISMADALVYVCPCVAGKAVYTRWRISSSLSPGR